jgi:hypothetical protein
VTSRINSFGVSPRGATHALLAAMITVAGLALAQCGEQPGVVSTQPDDSTPRSTVSTPIKSSTTKPGVAWTAPKSTVRQADRDAMVALIRDSYGLMDQVVLDALSACPRHDFMPELIADKAYADSPQPIPNGQLISQPWIVALMTHELHLTPNSSVLEIGTG